MSYKYCMVPGCQMRSNKYPDKVFISLPWDKKRRESWQKAMNRVPFCSEKSCCYVCEDHFNLEQDVENYMEWKMMKGSRIRIKKEVVPHIFDCQTFVSPTEINLMPGKCPPKTSDCELRKDLIELRGFLKRAKRKSVKNILHVEVRKMLSQIAKLKDKLKQSHLVEETPFIIKQELLDSESPDLPNLNPLEEITEVAAEEYFVDPSKIYINSEKINDISEIKVEKDSDETNVDFSATGINYIKIKTEITEEEDLPTIKLENGIASSELETKSSEPLKKTYMAKKKRKKKYPCPVCQKSFVLLKARKKHFCRHFKKTCVLCMFCGNIYISRTQFLQHFFVHSLKKSKFICKICSKHYKSRIELDQHIINHNNEITNDIHSNSMKLHQCDICFKEFARKRYLTHHYLGHSTNRPYKCNICGADFKRHGDRNGHLKSHFNYKPHKCNICGKGFKWRNNFLRHMRSHQGLKPYTCDVCYKTTSHKSSLVRHLLTHSEQEIESLELNLQNNIRNLIDKSQLKLFTCNLCSIMCASRTKLESHKLVHSGEKPFECQICSKRFRVKYGLKTHMEVHEKNRFKCNVCSEQFACSETLSVHREAHSIDRPFKCDECFKMFSLKKNLQDHMSVHVSKRHQCELCSKAYSRKARLSDHIKRFHLHLRDNESFQCEKCLQIFNRKSNLVKHTQRIHTEIVQESYETT